MKTSHGVTLATLYLWSALPVASAVRASAAESGRLNAKYNVTKITHGNSCIATGPQFTWEFELLKGTLRTLVLHCPDSEFHMVTDPPGYAPRESNVHLVADPSEYVQRAASIERLGITYETTDFYNGSIVQDPLYEKQISFPQILTDEDCLSAVRIIRSRFQNDSSLGTYGASSMISSSMTGLLRNSKLRLCKAYKGLVERYRLAAVSFPVVDQINR
ncbi:hypothetical protein FOZ63_028863 [Perkinsus olseni]|uniref:Uncharacterized protein n=1 Tax=Perkinsus olseni TaxID=32597 RepID=A0A7J6RHF8_PEROL|nr:hypothetical protein FOZ60_001202 [Perkinsus olseni]KAF4717996.1 hypothetical protein FOZ62_027680 [Perkinsus olseni]KAF4720055.1 hypothetical protein FOZ63_028863 [Perkinsus olseni]